MGTTRAAAEPCERHTRTSTTPASDGIPAKSLMGLPWRYAIRCIDELGLILRAEVIWSKPNGLPESVTDRVRRSHEQMVPLHPAGPLLRRHRRGTGGLQRPVIERQVYAGRDVPPHMERRCGAARSRQ